MSKLLKRFPLAEDNSFHISQIKASTDSLIATHTAIATAHHSNANDLASKKVVVALHIMSHDGTLGPGYYILSDVGDSVTASFWADTDVVDTSQDVLFTWVYQPQANDADLDTKRFMAAIKTDNSENHTWNIDAGTVLNRNVTQFKLNQEVFTFPNADINGDDLLIGMLENEDTTDVVVRGCYCTYYLK